MTDEVSTGMRFGPLAFTGDEIEIGKEIGSGATARVYSCTRVKNGEELAVKVIDIQRYQLLSTQSDDLHRLEREVNILRELKHERCVGLYDIYRNGRLLFLVMERLRGGELFDTILARKRLSEFETRYIVRQLLEGLSFMHSKQIVHRDLKPENILIASSSAATPPDTGTLYEVKITDFGLSKFVGGGSMANTLVGTPQYLAPEVLDGSAYDERVDLWSLGAAVYVMLAGKYPFKGENLAAQTRAGKYDMAGGVWPTISDAAKKFIQSLLRVNPAERATLDQCFKHPWMNGKSEMVEELTTIVEKAPVNAPSHTSDIELAFSPKELLFLQMSFVRSLEAACLACRQTNPELARQIQQTLHNGFKFAQQTLEVFTQYAQTAKAVRDKVLPDLQMGVHETVPEMAVEMLDSVNGWLREMQRHGDEAKMSSAALADQLHAVILEAQRENLVAACDVDPSPPPRPMLALPDTDMPAPSGHPNEKTKQLFDGLTLFVGEKDKDSANTSSSGSEADGIDKKCVDLLFMAPDIRSPIISAPHSLSPGQADAEMADVEEVERKDSGGETCQALALRPSPPAPDRVAWGHQAAPQHPLLRALQELRRVSQILQSGMTFWMDMRCTVQQLSLFKDHTRALLMYSSKSQKLREQFDMRLAEYSQFWGSLMVVCQEFCSEMRPGLQEMSKIVAKYESLGDIHDARIRASREAD